MRKLIYLIVLLVLIHSVNAFDFTITLGPMPSGMYEGESQYINAEIKSLDSNFCDITCNWQHLGSDDLIVNGLAPGETAEFSFNVVTGSSGYYQEKLEVICTGTSSLCLMPDVPHDKTVAFSYSYLGDGKCETKHDEDCTDDSKEPSCKCSSPKSCINDEGDSNRDQDSKKCSTYCGNNVIETKYESCENCPTDVGKCDGISCNSASECEGNYCVHNKCSHTKYILGDSFCDSAVGENCLNSVNDCKCDTNERCSTSAVCETYCGNDICEASEQGICHADCEWCGDEICDESKESCKSCSTDCGECEKTEEEAQITEQLRDIRAEAKITVEKNKNNKRVINITIGSTLSLIILVVIGWFIFKRFKSKNDKKGTKKNVKHTNKCPKCKSTNKKNAKFCNECGHKLK